MDCTAMLNTWASAWSAVMVRGLIDGTALLLLIFAFWLAFRRRMSAHLACGLFLLVPLRLALAVPVVMPAEAARLWPGSMVGRVLAGTETNPWASPVVARHAAAVAAEAAPRVGSEVGFLPLEPGGLTGPDAVPADGTSIGPGSAPVGPAASPIPGGGRSTGLTPAAQLMLVWLSTVVALFMSLAGRNARMARRVRGSERIDPGSLPVDLPRLCRLAGLRRPVPLVAAPWAASPAVWGLFRPCLLLPA